MHPFAGRDLTSAKRAYTSHYTVNTKRKGLWEQRFGEGREPNCAKEKHNLLAAQMLWTADASENPIHHDAQSRAQSLP